MSEHLLQYGQTSIPYHLSYTNRQTLAIHVHPDLHVTVEAPLDSEFPEIEKRLHKKAAWILRQQRNFRRYSFEIPPRQYVSGETHRYLGRQYRLRVIEDDIPIELVRMDRGILTIYTNDKSTKHVKGVYIKWLRERAQIIFAEQVAKWYPRFERFGIEHPKIKVRQMRSQWGSCSAKGRMTLNLKLVMVPKQFIDYVIVHELCHLIEHNHGAAFYALMSKIMPDWEDKRDELNRFEF